MSLIKKREANMSEFIDGHIYSSGYGNRPKISDMVKHDELFLDRMPIEEVELLRKEYEEQAGEAHNVHMYIIADSNIKKLNEYIEERKSKK